MGLIQPVTEDTVIHRFRELGIPLPGSPQWNKDLDSTLTEFFNGRLLLVADSEDDRIFISTR